MFKNEGWNCLPDGKTTGKLIVGDLNTISGILASDYFSDITDSIFCIEDSFKDMARH